uniref:Replication factor C subunit 3-like n=2 Tax=Sinocyclocheilus grahami TaxID=75366 RepID=A0A672P405_SINGR
MSLWVDKYRPSSLAKLDYHKEQANQLKNLVQCGDFPHLLVYGPSGAGKKTRIMCLLRELYGPGVEKLRIEHQSITTPSKKKLEINTIASNYHLEVNPSDAGNSDRVVIQELIKTVAQSQQIQSSAQREFKVVLLTEVDRLTKDAQHALRRTMEKYMSTCRLILCCNSTSKVIAPIRSRCLAVRVPLPSVEEVKVSFSFKKLLLLFREKMSLWVDKYRPSSLAKLDYHKEQANQLKNLVKKQKLSRQRTGVCVWSD